jgi:small subunit ribosomal protein S13
MARIAGIELPPGKRADIGLTAIYGIGRSAAGEVLAEANIPPERKIKDLSEEEINIVRRVIDSRYSIEGELRRAVSANVSRLINIGSYRGFRHRHGLPVRGQRTRCNARTRKGPRRTVGRKKKS